ncbi:Immune-associated nucleotide-binding protein 9 [Bulinus truncatus]|nr:Immune-associated nucleotide-binding protein 9 [Bulinus truncatus]
MSLNSEIDLLLIGKSGDGKSSTGNSIFGRKVFKINNSKSTVVASFDFDFVQFNGRIIKIVDGLRTVDYRECEQNEEDTSNDQPVCNKKTALFKTLGHAKESGSKMDSLYLHEMACSFVANPDGYHAFIIVLKFGHENKKKSKTFLKAVFGKEFSMKFCIIVMTGGDLFEQEVRGITFKDWCQRQTGHFKDLLLKCNNRIVLFNNQTEDQIIKERQVQELFSLINQMQGKRFCNANFNKTKKRLTKLTEKFSFQMISEEIFMKTSLVLHALKEFEVSSGESEKLKSLSQKSSELVSHLQGVKNISQSYHSLVISINKTVQGILELQNEIQNGLAMIVSNLTAECLKAKEELKNKFKSSESQSTESDKELNEKLEECDILLKKNIETKRQAFQNAFKPDLQALLTKTKELEKEYSLIKSQYKENFWVPIIKDMTMANINKQSKVDILLIGRTGNGKSSTGNSILGRKIFTNGNNTMSETKEMDFDYAEVEGRIVKVVDVQGVKDTNETTTRSIALFIREMEKAVVANPKGYHAFLIVVKFGNRFTREEKESIQFLKDVFGETFVKDYCIIILTFGDLLHQEDQTSLEEWCQVQTGDFKILLEECCGRIVLFNNISNDAAEKKKQISELFTLIDQLKGKRYTDEHFKRAKKTQIALSLKLEETEIREKVLFKTRLIMNKLEKYQESLQDELDGLENLITETETLVSNLKGVDKGTKLLNELISNVTSIKCTISKEIKLNMIIREEKEAHRKLKEKLETLAAKEKETLKKYFSSLIIKCSDNGDKQKLEKELCEKLKKVDEKNKQVEEEEDLKYKKKITKKREKTALKIKEIENRFLEIKHRYISGNVLQLLKNFFSRSKHNK